jgi:hypothetical protein
MSPRVTDDEEWEDDLDTGGDTDELDTGADDEPATMRCPYCGWEIPEDTPRCPYCENYLSAEDAPTPRKPLWIVVGVTICLYVVYRWIVG